MRSDIPTLTVLGIPVVKLNIDDALRELVRIHDEEAPALAAYVNAHTLNLAIEDAEFREVLLASNIILNDGAGLDLAAKLAGDRFPANLNGSDLTPLLLGEAAKRDWGVYFLGESRAWPNARQKRSWRAFPIFAS